VSARIQFRHIRLWASIRRVVTALRFDSMESGGTASATLSGQAADGQAGEETVRRKTSRAARGAVPTESATDPVTTAGEVTDSAATADSAARADAGQAHADRADASQADAGRDDAAGADVAEPTGSPAGPVAGPVAAAISRARRAAGRVRDDAATEAHRQAMVLEFFAQPVHDYVYQSLGRPVTVLRAGCVTPLAELGLDKLRQDGFNVSVVTVDVDHRRRPRAENETQTRGEVTVGDLRAIPLPPRSFDVVHCSLLLDRISHVQLVLDRFAAALRPGGLLLLRIRDRDSAGGFLDRRLPGWARRALWARLYPGEPGPFPAVYEPTGSSRGIAAYMLMRGLVITQRRTTRTLPHQPERLTHVLSVIRGLIAWLSRGRLTDAHDEMLFVIRKPEDRFARVVLTLRRPGGVPSRD
jgi:SAM-dependent methyltransferase